MHVLLFQLAIGIAKHDNMAGALRSLLVTSDGGTGEVGEAIQLVSALIGIVVATLPLGFLFYQLYYYRFRGTVLGGLYVRADRGRDVLEGLDESERRTLWGYLGEPEPDWRFSIEHASGWRRRLAALVLGRSLILVDHADQGNDEPCNVTDQGTEPIDLRERWRQRKQRHEDFEHQWHHNWYAVRSFFSLGATDAGLAEVRRVFQSRWDEYHALGASRTAIFWSISVALGYNLAVRPSDFGEWRVLLFFSIALGLTLYILRVVHFARSRRWASVSKLLQHAIRRQVRDAR